MPGSILAKNVMALRWANRVMAPNSAISWGQRCCLCRAMAITTGNAGSWEGRLQLLVQRALGRKENLKMQENLKTFESVLEFSRKGIIPEATTRRLIKNNMVPGFFSGRKFLINTSAFIQVLENAGNANIAAVYPAWHRRKRIRNVCWRTAVSGG